ncbi:MAG: 50S ribosomal protein L31e [Nitrososphaerota archaeon]
MSEAKEVQLVLNLREVKRAPPRKRAKKAVLLLAQRLRRLFKKERVKLDPKLNERLWARGIRRPPSRIRLKVRIEEDQVVALPPEEGAAKA